MSANASAAPRTKLTSDQRNSFAAAYLGWAMDAFDYFLVVLIYADIAKDFGKSLSEMAFITTMTLIMRPVGALIFGFWADRAGRRVPLMTCVTFYAIVGFLCAVAPNFWILMVLRRLYGIGMSRRSGTRPGSESSRPTPACGSCSRTGLSGAGSSFSCCS